MSKKNPGGMDEADTDILNELRVNARITNSKLPDWF